MHLYRFLRSDLQLLQSAMATLTKQRGTKREQKKRPRSSAVKADMNAFAQRCQTFLQNQFAGRTIADSTAMLEDLRTGG